MEIKFISTDKVVSIDENGNEIVTFVNQDCVEAKIAALQNQIEVIFG